MRTAQISITAEDISAAVPGSVRRSPAALAIIRRVPPGVVVIDNGEDISYKLPSGNWLGADLPGEAQDFGAFYEGHQFVRPIVFDLDVPDETDAGIAA